MTTNFTTNLLPSAMPEWLAIGAAAATLIAAVLGIVPVLTSLGLISPFRDAVGTAEAKVRAAVEINRAKDLIGRGPGAEYFRPQFIADHLEIARTRRALRHLQAAMCLDPANPDSHRLSGIAYRRLNEHDAMFAEYETAERLEPGNCANVIGNLLDELGEWSRADSSFKAFLRKHVDDAVAHANRARVLIKLNRLSDAESAARAAIDASPTYPGGYNELAAILLQTGRRGEAVEVLERSVEKAPRYEARAFVDLAAIYFDEGEMVKAEEYVRQALQNEPNSAAAHELRQHVLLVRGDTDQARNEERVVKRLKAQDHERLLLLRKAATRPGRAWLLNA